jgi:hypothetical protein
MGAVPVRHLQDALNVTPRRAAAPSGSTTAKVHGGVSPTALSVAEAGRAIIRPVHERLAFVADLHYEHLHCLAGGPPGKVAPSPMLIAGRLLRPSASCRWWKRSARSPLSAPTTLTKNEMTVQAVAIAEHLFEVSGVGYDPHGA